MAEQGKVAERIRMYRERLGMGVADLAAKSGVVEEVVKAVESGEVLPALGVLTKLSRALGQRLGTFMDDQFKPDPIVTRAGDRTASGVTSVGLTDVGYTYYSLAPGKPDRHLDPFYVDLPANLPERPSSHEGEELIICITGEVELQYGAEKVVLRPGDSAYYNSVVKHALSAMGGKPASIYGIVYMPF